MTKIVTFKELDVNELVLAIKQNKIIIYPTDTIYGIGCNAEDYEAVEKIRKIKQRNENPFSVIAPSKEWIKENCILEEEYINKLPGSFTLIVNTKKQCVAENVNFQSGTLGVRIPAHPLTNTIQSSGLPFITTSVNLAGEKPIIKINQISEQIKNQVDYIIDQGTLNNNPSTLINLTKETPEIIKRN